MRKFIGVLLSILCICCAAIGLTGCKKDKHIHTFDKQVITDEYKATDATCTEAATYYYSCECGEKGTETFGYGSPLGHSFTNYVSDNNATCTEDGTKTAKCDRCDKKNTVRDIDSKLHHSYTEQIVSDEYLAAPATCTEAATYYYSCECGEKGTETFSYGDPLGHSFTNYVSDNNATCTEDGTKTAKCDRCNETDTIIEAGSAKGHTEVIDKAKAATCIETGLTEGKHCSVCNKILVKQDIIPAKGHTEVIDKAKAATCIETGLTEGKHCSVCNKILIKQEIIPAKGHTEVIDSAKAATCTESGLTEGKHCSVCNTVLVKQNIVPAKGHTYSEEWSQNETEHWHSATCGHNVEKDRATHTFDENKKCTVCDYITVKPLGLELQSSVFNIDKSNKTGYLKVANAVTDYDFSDKFTVADGARFDVCTDKECNNKIASKKTDIVVGDNIFYILVTNGNDVASYTITLRRRPIYTVSFNANGGTAVNSQTVEEDAIIPEPVTTRAGYTFISWSYDFTQPIMGDTIIVAAWMANINTTYKVEYYLENLEDNNYTLIETENLQGTTDTTATAEIKTYDHFTFYKNNSILSGNVSGDGSLVLKVYYTRNAYTLSNANTSYGEITNAATKKYGNDKIDSVATEYLGCEFLGWYNGEELLSTAREYTFTIKNNVTAKFKVKDEMSNFNFNSSVDTCNITGVKDKTIKSAVIPDYVTSIGERAFDGCSDLTSVTIGNGVTSIGNSAFQDCCKLTNVIWNAENCTRAGSSSYPIFKNCSKLTNVTIGVNVKTIPSYAFWYCSGLTSVTIGNSVTSIGDSAFYSCSGIESLVVMKGNKKYHSANNCIIETETKELIAGCKTSIIPSDGSVTSIGDDAFDGCSGLTSVTIPDSVTSIGSYAFRGCYKLVEVINKSGLNITKGSSDNGNIAYYALNVKKDGTSDIVNKEGYLFYTYDNVNYLLAYVGSNTNLTLPDDYNGQNYKIYKYAFV